MKIYTKTGDQGETGLLGGVRVSKTHPAVRATGSVDETNSLIGVVRGHGVETDVDKVLMQIQHDLFDLGSRIAACLSETNRAAAFPAERALELERLIDRFQDQLPPLTAFILPSGSLAGSALHLGRSVCRRAECELVALLESGEFEADPALPLQDELIYLNRLSDLLFVLARFVNQQKRQPETLWVVGRDK